MSTRHTSTVYTNAGTTRTHVGVHMHTYTTICLIDQFGRTGPLISRWSHWKGFSVVYVQPADRVLIIYSVPNIEMTVNSSKNSQQRCMLQKKEYDGWTTKQRHFCSPFAQDQFKLRHLMSMLGEIMTPLTRHPQHVTGRPERKWEAWCRSVHGNDEGCSCRLLPNELVPSPRLIGSVWPLVSRTLCVH